VRPLQWLKENNVPGMYGVDTRALTKKLRVHGSMKGKIVMDEDVPLRDPNQLNLVAEVRKNGNFPRSKSMRVCSFFRF
jgi:carbamoylphosphate synthase small subunit